MAIIERSLDEALRAAKLDKLPPMGGEGNWSKAIALVTRRMGGIQSYAIVEKKADGVISVKNVRILNISLLVKTPLVDLLTKTIERDNLQSATQLTHFFVDISGLKYTSYSLT